MIIYPTGGGTGLIGMWKAFAEMEQMGWIGSKRPRMVTVQAAGCAPIVRAFEEGKRFADEFPNAATTASGLRVPKAIGDFLILDALRESGGTAISVTDEELISATGEMGAGRRGFLRAGRRCMFACVAEVDRSGLGECWGIASFYLTRVRDWNAWNHSNHDNHVNPVKPFDRITGLQRIYMIISEEEKLKFLGVVILLLV